MQDAGLLIRQPADQDRRVMVVHLTEKGRVMREPITSMCQTLEETVTRLLSPQQAESLISAAEAVTDAINARTKTDRIESETS